MREKVICVWLSAIIRQRKNCLSYFFLFLLCMGYVFPVKGHTETLTVGGTGGALGTMHILAQEYMRQHPDIVIEILPSLGSGGGIKAMLRRAVDISLSARKLKEAERQEGLVEVAIGTTPFVIAVAKENASNSITAAELADIYSGKLQEWPDGSLLRLVLRPEGDTDTTLLRSMSPEMNAAMDIAHKRPGLILGVTDQDSADRIEKQPGSIGTSTLAQMLTEKRNLKALAINGVIPSPETIANKEYPLSKTYFFITEKEPSSSVKEFLRFVQSDSGQSLLFPYGYQIQP